MKSVLLNLASLLLSFPFTSISVHRNLGSLAPLIDFGRTRVELTLLRKEGMGGVCGVFDEGDFLKPGSRERRDHDSPEL